VLIASLNGEHAAGNDRDLSQPDPGSMPSVLPPQPDISHLNFADAPPGRSLLVVVDDDFEFA
jgi:hypothetical protein